jgi:photosystem II stability/assembly factor-like uncharacterized protein
MRLRDAIVHVRTRCARAFPWLLRAGAALALGTLIMVAVAGGTPTKEGPLTPRFGLSAGGEGEEGEGREGKNDFEALEETNGDAALRFRHSQQVDEKGEIPNNAFINAAAHVDTMRPLAAPKIAGITNQSWSWLGPGNIGGRIRSILIDPTAPDTMWIGSVTGGIFKTTNGGGTWTHLDDFMSNLAVSSLVAHPSTPNTIYAATGENETGNTGTGEGNRGAGVFKSTNGGVSWSQLASTANSNWWYTNRLAVSPANANTLLAATWRGIFRTQDGGTGWTQEFSGEIIQDIDFDPSNGNNAIAGGWAGRALYSTNGGDTWQLATGIPTAGASRVEVAYAPTSPNITYASVFLNGGALYKSTDGGHTYAFAGPNPDVDYLGGQGWYDNALWVSPSNANHVIVGGIDLYKSTDGGQTLTKISNWAVNQQFVRTGVGPDSAHADHHAIVASPSYNVTPTVFFGNDGGIFRATDVTTVTPTSGWQELNNNLGITQFYGASGSAASGKILGGTQDNGTLRYNGATETWNMTFGGDGGFNGVDQTDSNFLYGEYVYGAAFRSSDGGVNGEYISSCSKGDAVRDRRHVQQDRQLHRAACTRSQQPAAAAGRRSSALAHE